MDEQAVTDMAVVIWQGVTNGTLPTPEARRLLRIRVEHPGWGLYRACRQAAYDMLDELQEETR